MTEVRSEKGAFAHAKSLEVEEGRPKNAAGRFRLLAINAVCEWDVLPLPSKTVRVQRIGESDGIHLS